MRFSDLELLESDLAKLVAKVVLVRAPAMQPVHCCMSRRVCLSMSGSATTSVTAKRPPLRAFRRSWRSGSGSSGTSRSEPLCDGPIVFVAAQEQVPERAQQAAYQASGCGA